jgi:ABC-type glutathione transport system ATPase component
MILYMPSFSLIQRKTVDEKEDEKRKVNKLVKDSREMESPHQRVKAEKAFKRESWFRSSVNKRKPPLLSGRGRRKVKERDKTVGFACFFARKMLDCCQVMS